MADKSNSAQDRMSDGGVWRIGGKVIHDGEAATYDKPKEKPDAAKGGSPQR